MPDINMLSSADKVKAQGVLSAYIEQVRLVKDGLNENYNVMVNNLKFCDIMHYHTIDFKFFLSLPFAKLHGSTVAYVHFVPETLEESIKLPRLIKKVFYKYVIWFYKSVDYLVVVNPYFIDVLKKYNIDKSKITYIPNYVSEEDFYVYEKEKIDDIKKQLNIPRDKFVVLGVGQVQTRKGILDFIQVAKKLPDVQFIWAGGFSFGSITYGYKELKSIMGDPPGNVKFTGIISRKKMNDIYNAADLMFLPSYNELFPMSILESMALGKPVLVRDLSIYHSILLNYYLKGNNVNEFTEIINKIRNDNHMYESCCKSSWQCHELYSKKHVLKMWKNFYDNVYYNQSRIKLRSRLNEK